MLGLAGCVSEPDALDIVHVPDDASLADAGDLVADGGVILIAPGTYTGTLEVSADDVTVRGEDRNGVVIDGELTRSSGVVGSGERITVENLTVKNFLQNGVLITGVTDENGAGLGRGPDGYLPEDVPDPVPGYLVQAVTAENNGLYGIYAFNRTGGIIRNNLASGGSDAGIYVGQCEDCNAWVDSNVTISNAVGIELANASGVSITGNRVVDNRIGLSVLSNYLEAHGPTVNLTVAGNVISDNNNADTPEQAGGAFGVGVGLAGTVDAEIFANRVTGNGSVGVWVTSSEDFAPSGTNVHDNTWGDGLAVAYAPAPDAVGDGNCFALDGATSAEPEALLDDGCDAPAPGAYSQPPAPAGISFADVPSPPQRPGLDTVDEKPRELPDSVDMPDTAGIDVPSADLLEDAS